jgi:hypothetical protein
MENYFLTGREFPEIRVFDHEEKNSFKILELLKTKELFNWV